MSRVYRIGSPDSQPSDVFSDILGYPYNNVDPTNPANYSTWTKNANTTAKVLPIVEVANSGVITARSTSFSGVPDNSYFSVWRIPDTSTYYIMDVVLRIRYIQLGYNMSSYPGVYTGISVGMRFSSEPDSNGNATSADSRTLTLVTIPLTNQAWQPYLDPATGSYFTEWRPAETDRGFVRGGTGSTTTNAGYNKGALGSTYARGYIKFPVDDHDTYASGTTEASTLNTLSLWVDGTTANIPTSKTMQIAYDARVLVVPTVW